MSSSNIGDVIVARIDDGRIIEGTIRFSTKTFISIDERGVTAVFKLDPNTNSWLFGKERVVFVTKSLRVDFAEQLAKVVEMARVARPFPWERKA